LDAHNVIPRQQRTPPPCFPKSVICNPNQAALPSEPSDLSALPDDTPPPPVTRPLYPLFTSPAPRDVDLLPTNDNFYGDTYQLPKPDIIFRVSVKNVNHVSTNSIDAQITLLCKDQEKYEIDIQGIIEHKCDMTKIHVRQAFDMAARHVHHPVRLELGSSDYQSITDYKPGGTAIIAQVDITGRIKTTDSDKYGRWSYTTTTGAQGSTTVFITAYQVCKKPTNLTGTTAFHQQQAAFIKEKRSNLNPRHNFRRDLLAFVKQHHNRGHHIVLMGDFNEHIQDHNSFLQQVCLHCNLIDM
jgi:exonuclease III